MSTLRVVAARAGVHIATASAVLNGTGGNTRVGLATRRRVLAAARQLAYVPNELARHLRTGQSNMVGFLGGDLRNPFFAELTAALEAELNRHGLQLVVSHLARSDPATLARALGSLRRQRTKSIICWEETTFTRASADRDDVVAIGFTRRQRPGVWLDLEEAIRTAVQEMRGRGFRRLGFYLPRGRRESPSVQTRTRAFVEICRAARMPHPVLAAYEGESWDLAAAATGAAAVLREHAKTEAWVGFNDVAALALLSHEPVRLRRRVVCFDGTTVARYWPGEPVCLDLQVSHFARRVAEVVAGQQDAAHLGRRENWLRPTLLVKRNAATERIELDK